MEQSQNQNALDDREVFGRVDKNEMLSLIEKLPQMLEEGWAAAEGTPIRGPEKIGGLVISGMGGSAISGDIAATLLRGIAKFPVSVNRNYTLPAFVGKDTLLITLSYSGNTEETISSFKEALSRGASIISVTSGGEIAELCAKNKIPVIRIPKGLPPRAALGYLLSPVLYILYKLGIAPEMKNDLESAVKLLKQLAKKRGQSSPLRDNEVKQLAVKLSGKLPVLAGSDGTTGVAALRWKTQFNENSKETVVYAVFPELNHNDMVNFSFLKPGQHSYCMVLLRDEGDIERMKKRIEITKSLVSGYVGGITEVWSQGDSMLERLMSLIQFGDLLSVYIAILKGIDPTPVDIIEKLKKELQR